jgi:hypothetical protein
LRGLEVDLCRVTWSGALPPLTAGVGNLIALSFELFAELRNEERLRLKKWAEAGATIYIRGALERGRKVSLAPLSDLEFDYSLVPSAVYHFSRHPMLPSALAGETVEAFGTFPCALGLGKGAQSIVAAGRDSERGAPSIFANDLGAGVVVCDLNPEDDDRHTSLLAKLSDPTRRAATVGALAAVDWAAGRDPNLAGAVNLVIDDRPINYDYFSSARTEMFLRHWDAQLPGVHVDYAWTPNQTRPHRRYIDLLNRYNTGFVWHGLLRHVDHRTVTDPAREHRAGMEFVRTIVRRYSVPIQPVMIFPFEKDTPAITRMLRENGFIAKVQSFDYEARMSPPGSYYALRSTRSNNSAEQAFSVIFRDAIEMLSRDRMLALAALGMPIVAIGHPRNLALRRLGLLRDSLDITYFDPVLKFAAEKSLRPLSLEEIAAEAPLD